MSMQIPQDAMVKAFGGAPTGSNTQVGRSVAADMAAEGTFIPPTQGSTATPRTMSAAASSGIESLKAQNLNVTPTADGSGYTISGTAQAAGSASIPSGLAGSFRNATPDEHGNVSMFVPTQDFAGSYAATQTGHAAGSVPMATIGTHNAAASLTDQGITIRPDPGNNGTVNLVAQKGADLNGVNATPEVAQAVAQLNQQMLSGGANVLNVPASTFNGYTGGAPAAENLVNAGSYMPQDAPQPAGPPPTAASPIPQAPQSTPGFPLTQAEAAAEAQLKTQAAPTPAPQPVTEEHSLPRRPDPESGPRDDNGFPFDIGAAFMRSMENAEKKEPPRGHGNLDNRNFNNKN